MKVVVTGIGCLIANGQSPKDILSENSMHRAPEVLFNLISGFRLDESKAVPWIPRKYLRKMDRMSKIVSAVVAMALKDAKLADDFDTNRVGLVMNTGFGSAGSVNRILSEIFEDDPVISPLLFPNVVANAAAGQAAISFGLRGPSSALGGIGSLMYGYDMIQSGRADYLVVGGGDEMTYIYAQALNSAEINLSLVGEGAAFIVIETEETAKKRGVRPYAELSKVSMASTPGFNLHGASAYADGGLERVTKDVIGAQEKVDWLIGAGCPGTQLRDGEHALIAKYGISHALWPKDSTGEMFACSNALNTLLASLILYNASLEKSESKSVLVSGYDVTRGQSAAALFHRVDDSTERRNVL